MDEHLVQLTDAQRLADFTDRLLAGEEPVEAVAPSGNGELLQLQADIRSIQRNLHPRPPDAVLRNRIRARLASEWSTRGPRVPHGKGARRPAWRTIAAWTAGIVVLLILAGTFLASRLPVMVPGAAQAQGSALIIVLVALAIIAIIFWSQRKKP